MSMRARPQRGNNGDRDEFVKQAAEVETTRLNCFIPTELHQQLRMIALLERSNVTKLVIEGMSALVARRQNGEG